MNFKNLLLNYITFYDIYQEAQKKNAYSSDKIALSCKENIISNKNIDKEQIFYYVGFKQNGREWSNNICFSYGEAMARKAYITHKRVNTRFYLLELESNIEATINEITLLDILKHEIFFSAFINRISYLTPFDKDEVLQISNDYRVTTLWNFEDHLNAQFLLYDGKKFFHFSHELPSSMSYGYSTVIDSDGRYGIIHNKTILLSGVLDMEWVLPCEYHYINIEGLLAEVQKENPKYSDDYREYQCEIVDLESKKIYTTNAICNKLEFDNTIVVGKDRLLQYIKIDTKKKKIVAKSLSYSYIVTPIHYALKPVQDTKTKLWGYIDKDCQEIISPKYKDYNFFNDGYTIIKNNDKAFVINESGDVIIKPKYKTIEHYNYDYFFVEDNYGRWAVFLRDKIYIDFIDIDAIKEIPQFDSFPHILTREEKYYIILRYAMQNKLKALHDKRYILPLKEYISLFEPIRTEKELTEAGLWGQKVFVKKIPIGYQDIIKKEKYYYIGWSYPSSANMFDMSKELPIIFTKKDGSDFTLGIELEELELVKPISAKKFI